MKMTLWERLRAWLFGSPTPVPRVLPPRIEPAAGPEPASVMSEFEPEPPPSPKKIARTFGLDAADYLPIAREEIKEAAKGRNLLGNPWFGRRDLIPPADDPRTQLIDRAMVTQGLIAPSNWLRSTPWAPRWTASAPPRPRSRTRPP